MGNVFPLSDNCILFIFAKGSAWNPAWTNHHVLVSLNWDDVFWEMILLVMEVATQFLLLKTKTFPASVVLDKSSPCPVVRARIGEAHNNKEHSDLRLVPMP